MPKDSTRWLRLAKTAGARQSASTAGIVEGGTDVVRMAQCKCYIFMVQAWYVQLDIRLRSLLWAVAKCNVHGSDKATPMSARDQCDSR